MEFDHHVPKLVDNCEMYVMSNIFSVNFEAMKANWCTEPSCIKMLPDIGMVKRIQSVWKPANVDLSCYNAMEYPSLFLDSTHQLVYTCSYPWFHRQCTIPISVLDYAERVSYTLFLYFIWSASCIMVYKNHHHPYIDSTTVLSV